MEKGKEETMQEDKPSEEELKEGQAKEGKEEPKQEPEETTEESPKEASEEKPEETPEEASEEKSGEAPEEKAEEGPEEEPEKPEPEPEKKTEKGSVRKIVRVGAKDLDGTLAVKKALPGIPGVGFMFANAVSKVCGFGDKMLGELSEDELQKLKDIIESPDKYGIPSWLYNRRFDPVEGLDKHLISARLELSRKMDINELKKRKCYRGVRHIIGLPVRGQRTRSSFRKSATVGVTRARAKPARGK